MIRQAHKRGIPIDFKVKIETEDSSHEKCSRPVEEIKIEDNFGTDKEWQESEKSLSVISAIGV